jgi:hypothetical protein
VRFSVASPSDGESLIETYHPYANNPQCIDHQMIQKNSFRPVSSLLHHDSVCPAISSGIEYELRCGKVESAGDHCVIDPSQR